MLDTLPLWCLLFWRGTVLRLCTREHISSIVLCSIFLCLAFWLVLRCALKFPEDLGVSMSLGARLLGSGCSALGNWSAPSSWRAGCAWLVALLCYLTSFLQGLRTIFLLPFVEQSRSALFVIVSQERLGDLVEKIIKFLCRVYWPSIPQGAVVWEPGCEVLAFCSSMPHYGNSL